MAAGEGFTRFPNAMWGQFKPSTATVWIALCSHAWMDDGARPTIGRVMTMTRLKRSTVKTAIRELVAAEVLTVTARGDGTLPNLYGFPNASNGTFTMFDNKWWRLGLRPGEAMVLLAIKNFEGLPYGAVPGCRRLATMTKQGKGTVNEVVIPALQAIGILDVEKREWGSRSRSNSYTIVAVNDIAPSHLNAPEANPVVPATGHLVVPETDPVVPDTDPVVPGDDREEDLFNKTHSNKTDFQEDSSKETDCTPPRLRRDGEGPHDGDSQEKPNASPAPGNYASDLAPGFETDDGLSRGPRRWATAECRRGTSTEPMTDVARGVDYPPPGVVVSQIGHTPMQALRGVLANELGIQEEAALLSRQALLNELDKNLRRLVDKKRAAAPSAPPIFGGASLQERLRRMDDADVRHRWEESSLETMGEPVGFPDAVAPRGLRARLMAHR